MATELVDASKLDACCTAEANAIRAKTGSSTQIAYDWANSKGFADAIDAIPTGGSGIPFTAFTDYSWEIGAVNGNTGNTYTQNKTSNPARLRSVNLISGDPSKVYAMYFQFGTEWQGQYSTYDNDGICVAQFTVITTELILLNPAYNYAWVFRHRDGNTNMQTSDIYTINPIMIDLTQFT